MGKQYKFDERKYQLFVTPSGEVFAMPPGGDMNTYVRKGFSPVFTHEEQDTEPGRVIRYGDPSGPVRDNMWKGERCFILGGGPSLREFDWTLLRGERVIAVNRAFEVYPDADITCSLDQRWLAWTTNGKLGPDAQAAYRSYKGAILMVHVYGTKSDYPPRIQLVEGHGNPNELSPSLKYGLGYASNSGFVALNLALVLGCNEVYLLGFDMKGGSDGYQAHFHNGYPERQRRTVYKKFMLAFDKVAAMAQEKARIVNLNPDSALECFPKSEEFPTPAPVFVSCYTEDYKASAMQLVESLKQHKLVFDVEQFDDQGNWEANCNHKPYFIRDMRSKYRGRPVVWVDADAIVKERPKLLYQLECDFAGHHLDKELLSGTLYFGPGRGASSLVTKWIKRTKERPQEWDQRNLAYATCQWRFGKTYELPASYCKIFDNARQRMFDGVIEHYQESRRVKAERAAV